MNRLGIDIGRVIIGPVDHHGRADTAFLSGDLAQALSTPPAEGAFDAIRELNARTGGATWLVSKCGPRVQEKSRRWLDHHDFWGRTGVPRGNLRFCLERRDKALHCHELGITSFIDDRLDVLEHLRGFVSELYLFGVQPRPAPPWVTHLPAWSQAARLVRLDGDSEERRTR